MRQMMKRMLAMLLVSVLLCGVMNGLTTVASAEDAAITADISWYDSEKTEFTLTTAAQLYGMAELCNTGTTFENVTIKLGNDIDLNPGSYTVAEDGTVSAENVWPRCGYYQSTVSPYTYYYFMGNFDGCGHTISNMYCYSTGSNANMALFGLIKNATIKNLTLTGYSWGGSAVGGIAASAYGTNTIESCVSYVTVSGLSSDDGGILARVVSGTTSIHNCANYGDISTRSATSSAGVGGILGNAAGTTTISGCFNTGKLSAAASDNTNIGGILGYNKSASTTVEDCYNRGSIVPGPTSGTSTVYGHGGLIGYGGAYKATVKNCYNAGAVAVNGSAKLGGIVGYLSSTYAANYTNLWYDAASCAYGAYNGSTSVGTSFDTAVDGWEAALTAALGSAFAEDKISANEGYPILIWQDPDMTFTAFFNVINSDTGETLSYGTDYTVKIENHTADDAGNFELKNGEYTYTVAPSEALTAQEFSPVSGSFIINKAEAVVAVELAAKTYPLELTVTPSDSVVEVSNAVLGTITLPAAEIANGTAVYTLTLPSSLAYGDYSYRVSCYNYEAQSGSIKMAEATAKSISLADSLAATVRLVPTDAATADAVALRSCVVTNTDWNVVNTANDDGSYSLISGNYSVTVKAFGYQTTTVSFTVDASTESEKTVPIKLAASTGWDGSEIDTDWYTADAETYYIYNEAELAGFANLVNNGNSFSGRTVLLCMDLDLAGYAWTPIGNSSTSTKEFAGTFDGQGHVIEGLALNNATYQGLFGYVNGATIKNLSVATVAAGTTTKSYSGILIASALVGTTVENVTAEGQLTSSSCYVGGIIGYAKSVTVTDSTNNAAVTGTYQVGGIVGNAYGATAALPTTIQRCVNTGTITGSYSGTTNSYSAGGIVGAISSGTGYTVDNCANFGTVTGSLASMGGIAGYVGTTSSAQAVTISNCYNAGAVTNNYANTSTTAGGTGGIVGRQYNSYQTLTMQNCYNRAAITSSGVAGNTAALIGNKQSVSSATSITNCYYLSGSSDKAIGNTTDAGGYVVFESAEDYEELIELLGDAYAADDAGINDGFPIFAWQNSDATYKITFQIGLDDASNDDGTLTVTLTDGSGKVVDGVNGVYEVANGVYSYTVAKKGYETVTGSVQVFNGNVRVPLTLTATQYTYTVTVSPENAALSVTKDGNAVPVVSAENGVYTYAVTNGVYAYTASRFGYETVSGTTTISYANADVSVTLAELAQYTLTAKVAAKDGSTPGNVSFSVQLNGVEVAASAGANPSCKLPDGEYTYSLKAKGYQKLSGSFTIAGGDLDLGTLVLEPSSAWDGETYDTEWYTGNQTSYDICTAEEFAGFAKLVNEGNSFTNITVNLQSDVDLGGCAWTPVGCGIDSAQFCGTFDGHYNTVSGLYINIGDVEITTSGNAFGLFGKLYSSASAHAGIMNLEVEGVIEGTTSYSGALNLAGVVANVSGAYATLSDLGSKVTINVTQTGGAYATTEAGGICGLYMPSSSSVTGCYNAGDITVVSSGTSTSNPYVGGLFGMLNSNVTNNVYENCYNTGSVSLTTAQNYNLGGFTGDFGKSTLTNFYNFGAITVNTTGTASVANVGALAGDTEESAVMSNCYYLTGSAESATGIALTGSGNTIYEKTGTEMKDSAFVVALGSAFKENSGATPALIWQSLKVPEPEIEKDETLKIKTASILLESDLAINFYVADTVLDGWTDPYMVFTKALYSADGEITGYEEQTISDFQLTTLSSDGTPCHVFRFSGITTMEMSSVVTATIYASKDGVVYEGKTVNYSVLTYATNQLKKAADEKLLTLLVDLLNYGAAAQTYWNYNTANLANANLTDAQKAYATAADPTLGTCRELVKNDGATVSFKTCSLSLEEKVTINYYLNLADYAGSVDDLELRVTYLDTNGQNKTVTVDSSSFLYKLYTDGNYYYVANFSGLNAIQMRTTCTAEVFSKSGGERVSDTVIYSIESYAYSKASDANTNLAALVKAMMKYGDAAEAFFVQ